MTTEKGIFEQNAQEQMPQTAVAKTEVKKVEKSNSEKLTTKEIGDKVIQQVDTLCAGGFSMPKDFNYVNAIKAALLKLDEVVDKNKQPALTVCTQQSISQALFKLCVLGLDISLNQAYPIVRGNKLCIDPSYFGNILRVKRIHSNWNPMPRVIREGDVFEYEIDPSSGLCKLVKHETKLENIDKDFVGAYLYVPVLGGELDLYIMTAKQIKAAWAKSSSTQQATHKQFDEKMIKKTIINSGCTMVINSTPTQSSAIIDQIEEKEIQDVEFTEVKEVKEISEPKEVKTLPKSEKTTAKPIQAEVIESTEIKIEPSANSDDHDF